MVQVNICPDPAGGSRGRALHHPQRTKLQHPDHHHSNNSTGETLTHTATYQPHTVLRDRHTLRITYLLWRKHIGRHANLTAKLLLKDCYTFWTFPPIIINKICRLFYTSFKNLLWAYVYSEKNIHVSHEMFSEMVDLFTKPQRMLINVQPTICLLELLNNILLTLAQHFLRIVFNE